MLIELLMEINQSFFLAKRSVRNNNIAEDIKSIRNGHHKIQIFIFLQKKNFPVEFSELKKT